MILCEDPYAGDNICSDRIRCQQRIDALVPVRTH